MQATALKLEHLSTVKGLDPLQVLTLSGTRSVVLCMAAVWTQQTMTGCLEEKGRWVHIFWESVSQAIPEAQGCRLGWNTLFFAVPDEGVTKVAERFSGILQARQETDLMSFCVLCKVSGEPMHKIDVLDVLGHEVSTKQDFGANREFRPNGYRFYHLLDGKPYTKK